VFPVPGGIGIIAVAVAVPNFSILAMDHDFGTFPQGLIAGSVNSLSLSAVTGTNPSSTFLPSGPAPILMGNDMDILFTRHCFRLMWG
jgi:hypothetical protein